jgi:hypothetical protein
MGRPRKYPRDPVPDISPPAPEADDEPESLEDLEPEELVAYALDHPRAKLTPAMLSALNGAWRDNVRADDDEGKIHARRIAARLKRASHLELHPGCSRVTVDVPVLKRADNRGGIWYVKINERVYVGPCEMWECEARTVLELVQRYRNIESERMDETRESHGTFDLDRGIMIAERARAIQSA